MLTEKLTEKLGNAAPWVVAGAIFLGAAGCQNNPILDRYLPQGVEGLRMGMKSAEVKKIRPTVKIREVMAGKEPQTQGYEGLDRGEPVLDFFGCQGELNANITYFFEQDKLDQLILTMQWSGRRDYKPIFQHCLSKAKKRIRVEDKGIMIGLLSDEGQYVISKYPRPE